MTKPKGKTPSLLSMSRGTPEVHKCGRATPCDRCESAVATGQMCFRIPQLKNGFTGKPIFCLDCTVAIVEQTKAELAEAEVEKAVSAQSHVTRTASA